jgi:hypothetical protein
MSACVSGSEGAWQEGERGRCLEEKRQQKTTLACILTGSPSAETKPKWGLHGIFFTRIESHQLRTASVRYSAVNAPR